jgi:hypothetical protein
MPAAFAIAPEHGFVLFPNKYFLPPLGSSRWACLYFDQELGWNGDYDIKAAAFLTPALYCAGCYVGRANPKRSKAMADDPTFWKNTTLNDPIRLLLVLSILNHLSISRQIHKMMIIWFSANTSTLSRTSYCGALTPVISWSAKSFNLKREDHDHCRE